MDALYFNGDTLLAAEIEKLIIAHDLKSAVETGTYLGHTTGWLCDHFFEVWSIECNPEYHAAAEELLKDKQGLTLTLGDSALCLLECLQATKYPCLVYLDAHWEKEWPLLKELDAIRRWGKKPVLVIHDFKTDNPDLYYDSYDGHDLCLELVMPALVDIYGQPKTRFNQNAEGMKRGVLFVEP